MTAKTPVTVVELWHAPDCPHGVAYLPHLRALLARAAPAAVLRARVIASGEQARRERFLGSRRCGSTA